ncbi:MAG TPA: hypothetical protein VHT75_16685 [Acidimicrobiales bacterium]|nr:hypothetical protein [Acidimicrobiales bacterium]
MAPEDEPVDPRNAELLDWLWNIPDPPVAQDLAGPSDLTARLRWPEPEGPAAAQGDDQPTQAVPPVAGAPFDPYYQPVPGSGAAGAPPPPPASGPGEYRPAGFDYDAALAPIFAGQVPRQRFSWKRLLPTAAVLLVILAGVGVGYKLFGTTGSPKPANITFGGPTTDPSTTLAAVAVPVFGDTTTSSSSTSTTTTPTTTPAGATVPAAGSSGTTPSGTTTTTSRSTTTVARPTSTTALPVIVATVPPGVTTTPPISFPTSTSSTSSSTTTSTPTASTATTAIGRSGH